MPYEVAARCPCCDKIASKDMNVIQDLFGFRVMKDKKKTRMIPQSYCRECRGKKCSPNNKKCSGSIDNFFKS